MRTEHIGYTDACNFCVATIGSTLTTYQYYETRERAEWAMNTGIELLKMLGVKTKTLLLEREQERKIEGFYKHELN